MFHTYKLPAININGIASNTKMNMLGAFLKRQDIDLALLQELIHKDFETFKYYIAIVNTGT